MSAATSTAETDALAPKPSASASERLGSRIPRWAGDVLVLGVYSALAVACYWGMWRGGLAHVYLDENDGIQTMWFLNWVPYALGHGLNPFHASLVNVPHGVNLLDQTSNELLGLVLAPVTVVFGPTASFNLGETLALAGSATSTYFVVRRLVSWRPAAFAAGLLYGFGPYEIGQGTAHLNLSFCVLPPIIVLLVANIPTIRDGRSRRRGVLLGVLLVAQFFLSTEILVTTVLMALVLVVAMALRGRRGARDRLPAALEGYGWAIGILVLGLAYPAWYALAGPGHIDGPIQVTARYRADLFGLFVPDSLLRLAPSSFVSSADQFGGNLTENGSYLGLTLLATLAVGVVWLRRRAEVQLAVAVGLVAFVLSLGPRLVVRAAPGVHPNGSPTGHLVLPWALLGHLPLLRNVLPVRLSLYVDMAAAVVLAVVLDRLYARVRDGKRATLAAVAPICLAAVALIPLIPAVPYGGARPTPTSTYFASSFARELPAGQVTVLYPYPSAGDPQGALWQVQSDMRFAMPGGYFLVPGPTGTLATTPDAFNVYPSVVGNTLAELYLGRRPPRTEALRRKFESELASWHVRSLLAVPAPGTAPAVVSYLSWILGARPVHQADAYAWYHLGGSGRHQ